MTISSSPPMFYFARHAATKRRRRPLMTRVALYARYSTDNQREASIEDRFRICREEVKREKGKIVGAYRNAGFRVVFTMGSPVPVRRNFTDAPAASRSHVIGLCLKPRAQRGMGWATCEPAKVRRLHDDRFLA